MSVFSFHLVKTSFSAVLRTYLNSQNQSRVPGLIHAECMSSMTLGSPVFSSSRILPRKIAFFAQWEDEASIDNFLEKDKVGKILAGGWHTRLKFLRQWGSLDGFQIPDESEAESSPDAPVVAVTVARMKLLEVPRFIHWGRPVEKLVRDHPGTTFAMASIRLPRTVSTFSIWKSQKEMVNMVHGHSSVPKPKRHSKAMKERERKDFHFQFTTLRFKPIAEYGEWQGRNNIIPKLDNNLSK